jgi:protein involved in polysaccharide export with SLBB domain
MIIASGAFGQEIRVSVNGGVARPGEYRLMMGDRLSSLVERAGGFSGNARMGAAVLSRESERGKKVPLLRDLVSRIEREAFARPGEEARKREFLRKLSELKPGNLMPVRIDHPRLLKGSEDDLRLEDGDAFLVRSMNDPVSVMGAVNTPRTISGPPSKTDPEDAVREAGGFAADADRKHAYLIKADGTAVPLSRGWIRWNDSRSRWEITAFSEPAPQVEPGDTVVVPRKPSRSSWARAIDGLPRLLMEIHALTGVQVDPP